MNIQRELQQFTFNHLSDTELKGSVNLYKKRTAKADCLEKNSNIF